MVKTYRLDFNHSPNLFLTDTLVDTRLRSGDAFSIKLLGELDSFFAWQFGYKKAGFFDFSPYSIAKFLQKVLIGTNKIAVSIKLAHFCTDGVKILETIGYQIVWVAADRNGFLSEASLNDAKIAGAEFLFCSLIDEDTFLIENIDMVQKYFDNTHLILDISNAVKKIDIPKSYASIFWGYKLGSFKNSGVYLCDNDAIEFLDNIDLTAYAHLHKAYKGYKYCDCADRKVQIITSLSHKLGKDITTLINISHTLPNSIYCSFSGIFARDFIRALALDDIFVTNGELCSLGLSQPSRILQSIGYSKDESREALSISFDTNITSDDIEFLSNKISFKYKQIRAILE